jgi:hypothetical protein
MASPAASDLHLIPYTQASAAQLSQAIIAAREALDPYYPGLSWPQWHQAFKAIQPSLKLDANRVITTSQSLTELARYFAAPPPDQNEELEPQPQLVASQGVKKTYLMQPEVLESLNRVSFWRRVGKTSLVNLALLKLLAHYPESRIPIPTTEL